MKNGLQIAGFGGLLAVLVSVASAQEGIQPWSDNPWYWSYRGEPVLLAGGSDDDNLFQWPEELLIPQLERIAAAGGNLIRNTMSDRVDRGFEVYAFGRREDGRYDLEQWNPEYWERLERLLQETRQREIFVQIEIWDRFDYTDKGGSNHWQAHPYNPKNNVNYTYAESGFVEAYPDHPGANKQPFFFTTPRQRNNQTILCYQQRFVDKLLELSLAYDHVLYCIDNETKGEEEWARYWANYIKDGANAAGKRICVTEMWDDWDLRAERHKRTFDHPELYDFVDVSQNNHNRDQEHWDNFLYVKDYLSDHPRPINTTKIYGSDGNKFGHSDQDGIERFWRHLLAGGASVRFHRPPSGLGINAKAAACLRSARLLESELPLWTVAPANDRLADREEDEAYLVADGEGGYAVFFTDGGSTRLLDPSFRGRFELRWIDVAKGEWSDAMMIEGNRDWLLQAPRGGAWLAVIQAIGKGS